MAETVVLLHGLALRSPAMWPLSWRLAQAGFRCLHFDYGTLWGSPARASERLAMKLYALQPGPVHIVAHSLGGLIAVQTLLEYQQLPPGRVVCLGSPLAGSSAARALHRKQVGWINGRSGPLLRSGLPMLPEGRQVAMLAGGRSLGLGRWFSDFDGVNDGTVAVWETRLPGLAAHRVLPVSHSGLLLAPDVALHTAHFLYHGGFPERRQQPRT